MMFTEFAESEHPREMPGVKLQHVYHVVADNTYHVVKNGGSTLSGLIAVRTIGGRGIVNYDKNSTAVLDTDSLFFIAYEKITSYYPENDLWDFWWFNFTLSEALPLVMEEQRYFPFSEDERQQFAVCLSYMQNETPLSQLTGSAHFGATLSEWLTVKLTPHRAHEESIADLLRYIRENITRELTVEAMSAMCGLSSRRFRDVFQSYTNMTPKEYVLRLRMERGAFFLGNTSSPIYDIAEMTGFSDPFYFSRAFSKYFGVSPQKYRKLLHST